MGKDTLNKTLIILAGPTASGKTDLAIALAQKLKTGIVNADSRQIYKEQVIGVGRPSHDQLAMAPHYLMGHVSIFDDYSTGKFESDAIVAIETIFQNNNVAILTGGTGLYIQAILHGLDTLPDVDDEIKKTWEEEFRIKGIEVLQEKLSELDPDYYEIVDRQNPMRLLRAIQVSLSTGKPYSEFLNKVSKERNFNSLLFYMALDRDILYNRINDRVIKMFQSGWIEECRDLFPFRNKKALNTIGYKEIFEWLENPFPQNELIEKIQQATRRYAKRQETWFRHHEKWNMLNAQDSPDKLSGQIIQVLQSTMNKR